MGSLESSSCPPPLSPEGSGLGRRWEVCPEDFWPCPEAESLVGGTLVVGDLHNHTAKADWWLQNVPFEKAVFLGDFFDSHEDTPEDARRTALWLKKRLRDPRIVLLLGNHDVQYAWPENDALVCPGYSREKAEVIRSILQPEDWAGMRIAYFLDGWLASHAAFHPVWITDPSAERILARCEVAEKKAAQGKLDPIFAWGEIPGGLQRFSGPLWLAWEHFQPIPGINQICGHTPGETVRFCATADATNICIDAGNGSVAAMISEGEVVLLRCGI